MRYNETFRRTSHCGDKRDDVRKARLIRMLAISVASLYALCRFNEAESVQPGPGSFNQIQRFEAGGIANDKEVESIGTGDAS